MTEVDDLMTPEDYEQSNICNNQDTQTNTDITNPTPSTSNTDTQELPSLPSLPSLPGYIQTPIHASKKQQKHKMPILQGLLEHVEKKQNNAQPLIMISSSTPTPCTSQPRQQSTTSNPIPSTSQHHSTPTPSTSTYTSDKNDYNVPMECCNRLCRGKCPLKKNTKRKRTPPPTLCEVCGRFDCSCCEICGRREDECTCAKAPKYDNISSDDDDDDVFIVEPKK